MSADGWQWILAGVIAGGLALSFVASRSAPKADPNEARRRVADGAVLLDVRSPAEFASGHLPGAVNVPVGDIARRAGEIGPLDRPIVVYCRSGARSSAAASALTRHGFVDVLDLGAMSRW